MKGNFAKELQGKYHSIKIKGFRYMKSLKAIKTDGQYYYSDNVDYEMLERVAKMLGKMWCLNVYEFII